LDFQFRPECAMSANRREEPRSRLLKRGRIVFNGGFSSIDCVVLDVSRHGARLKVSDMLSVPDEFEVRMADSSPRWAELRHRGGDGSLGVRFVTRS
jgi:hypothetical protein